jgi:hypothetical protein
VRQLYLPARPRPLDMEERNLIGTVRPLWPLRATPKKPGRATPTSGRVRALESSGATQREGRGGGSARRHGAPAARDAFSPAASARWRNQQLRPSEAQPMVAFMWSLRNLLPLAFAVSRHPIPENAELDPKPVK